jgi:hypothetical protein
LHHSEYLRLDAHTTFGVVLLREKKK